MKKNREILERAFPSAYVAHGLNGTRAYKALKTTASDSSANVSATRLLRKPSIQRSILELLPHDDVEAGVIRDALASSNRSDKPIEWKDIHKFTELSLKLKGYLKDKDTGGSVNIAIIQGDSQASNDVKPIES